MKERLQSYTAYKERRKNLRNLPTMAELVLWQKLKQSQLGHKFRRQQSIGYYIVDFYCPEVKIVVEIDGSIHGERDRPEKDTQRQQWLEEQGFTILRYRNDQIKYEIDPVLQDIKRHCTTAINHPRRPAGRAPLLSKEG